MEIPAINLKAIVLVHWLLTVWGSMALWLPPSYSWGNFTVFALGVWAIAQRDSIDAVLMFLMGTVVTILTDIVHFGIYYPKHDLVIPDVLRFSAGMAILSLLLKPVSCFLSIKCTKSEEGTIMSTLGSRPCLKTVIATSPLTSKTRSQQVQQTPSTRPKTNLPRHTENV
uniref:Angiotensin II receptor-associated protein n=1 Tax=Neogobius melanostomus TaxID=47308 RepID=A0A8C6SLE0_9GOBI